MVDREVSVGTSRPMKKLVKLSKKKVATVKMDLRAEWVRMTKKLEVREAKLKEMEKDQDKAAEAAKLREMGKALEGAVHNAARVLMGKTQ